MRCCFLPCFGANSKRTKHLKSPNAITTATGGALTHVGEGAIEPAIQLTKQKIDCITESKEEQAKAAREAETPQTDEKKDDREEDDEVNKILLQEESSESLFSLSIGSKNQVSEAEKAETEVNSPMKLPGTIKEESEAIGSSPSVPHRVQQVSSVLNRLENPAQGKASKATEVESSKKEAKENTKSVVVKLEEQPNCIAIRKVNPNEESSAKGLIKKKVEENKEEKENHPEYRCRDCCDEGYEDINLDESDLDVTFEDNDPHNEKRREVEEGVEDVNGTCAQEESSESLFSLSIDSRKRISSAENVENEVNSVIMPAHVSEEEEERQRKIADVSSVLNPIENVTQGRVVKATVCRISLKKDKENINLVVQQDVDNDIPISPEPNLRLSNHKTRQKFNDKTQEVGVDISLSSWLVEPETTPISMNSDSANSVGEHTPKGGRVSPLSHEDRPIIGALTIEEIRKYSVSTSSRRSRSRSPDETPIIGTVGSYWSHTGQRRNSELIKNGKVHYSLAEDAKLKWSPTKLNTRLEKAFEAEAGARFQ